MDTHIAKNRMNPLELEFPEAPVLSPTLEDIDVSEGVVELYKDRAQQRLVDFATIKNSTNHHLTITPTIAGEAELPSTGIGQELIGMGLGLEGDLTEQSIAVFNAINSNRLPSIHPDSAIGKPVQDISLSQFMVLAKDATATSYGSVMVADRLDPENPIILAKMFDVSNRDKALEAVNQILKTEIPKRNASTKALMESGTIEPLPERSCSFQIDKSKLVPQPTLEALKALIGKEGEIEIIVAPPTGDRNDTSSVLLNQEILEKMGNRQIQIHGQVKRIMIARRNEITTSLEGETKNTVDAQGNYVGTQTFQIPGSDKSFTEEMMVGPKSPIVLGGSKQDHMPCDFTITTLDGATLEIKGLVTHNPVPKVGQIGPYEVNSCMSREEISKLAPQIIKAANAIRENEKLFGLRPGGIIKHINIVDTGGVNGWVLTNDERIVNITDEGIKQSPRLIGTHESTHAIDLGVGSGSTEGELSQGELTITFNKMKITNLATLPIGGRFGAVMQQPFLRDISESTFYQDNAKTAAGHAWDSPAELLASFVNSLQHPDWENNLKNKSFDFRKQYLDVMSSLGTALVDRPGVPATAPIHSLLDQRKAFLQEVQRNDPTALRVKRFGNEIANMKQLMMDINIGADADN